MRDRLPIRGGLLALLACGLFSGCQSLSPSLPPTAFDAPPAVPELSAEDQRFAEGLAHYAQGLIHDYNREDAAALTNYLAAITLDSSNEELTFRITRGLLLQKRHEEATAIMESMVERNPKSGAALAWLALVYRASANDEDAATVYERRVELAPKDAAVYIDYAEFLFSLERFDDADTLLQLGARKADQPLPLLRALGKLHEDRLSKTRESDPDQALTHRRAAIAAYEKASDLDPDDLEVVLKIGVLFILDGQEEKALKRFRKIEKRVPDDLSIKRRLALSFDIADQVDEAIATLQALQADPPEDAQIPYYLGELHQKAENQEAAEAAFALACQVSKKDPAPFIRLALMQMEGTPEAAIATLERGLERLPDHPRLTEILAYAYLEQDNAEAALPWFAKAEERLGEKAAARFFYTYGKAAYLAGDTNRAIEKLSHTMDDNVVYLQVFMRDLLAEENPDLEGITAFFTAFTEATPDEPAVFVYLGMLKSYAEDFEDALHNFETASTLARTHHRNTQILNEDFYFAYGAAHERTGDLERAEELFLKAIDLNPNHANAHNYIAYMWAERGERLDEALEHIREALDIDAESGAFLDTLGWIYYMQEKYEDALREIEKADAAAPGDATITEHRGDALAKLDRIDEAIEFWQAALALDPDNAALAEKLMAHGAEVDLPRAEDESAPPAALPVEEPPPPEPEPELEPTPEPAEISA